MAVYLMSLCGRTSAFLDHVTSMLLLTGVAIEFCVARIWLLLFQPAEPRYRKKTHQ
jgi:hypothetical protein